MLKTEDINRERLALLVREFGTQAKLAEIIEKSPAQISQWLNASKYTNSEKRRAMERATARAIEKKTGKPEGWMDQPLMDGERLLVKLKATRDLPLPIESSQPADGEADTPQPIGAVITPRNTLEAHLRGLGEYLAQLGDKGKAHAKFALTSLVDDPGEFEVAAAAIRAQIDLANGRRGDCPSARIYQFKKYRVIPRSGDIL